MGSVSQGSVRPSATAILYQMQYYVYAWKGAQGPTMRLRHIAFTVLCMRTSGPAIHRFGNQQRNHHSNE